MAKIAKAGVARLTKLYVGAAHTGTLTLANQKTFIDTATTTTTKVVTAPVELLDIDTTKTWVSRDALGQDMVNTYRGQDGQTLITFPMDINPSDAGQAILLAAGFTVVGFGMEIVGEDGGLRFKTWNAYATVSESTSGTSVYSGTVTMALTTAITTNDDTA